MESDISSINKYDIELEALYDKEDRYSIIEWVKKALIRNFVNFKGRARRKEYWYTWLAAMLLVLSFLFIEVSLDTDFMVTSILLLALIIPLMSVSVRRLHDTDMSGWWLLAAWVLPIINIFLLFVYISKTSPKNNKWGAPAKRIK